MNAQQLLTGQAGSGIARWAGSAWDWLWGEREAESKRIDDEYREALEEAEAAGICDPTSPYYDQTQCASIESMDKESLEDRDDRLKQEIDALHCGQWDMLCHFGLRRQDGTWKSPVEWPMPAKIAGGVVGVIAVGATVSVVRSIASLFGSE